MSTGSGAAGVPGGLAWPGLALLCGALRCSASAVLRVCSQVCSALLRSAPLSLVTGVVCCGSVRCGAGEKYGIR